MTRRDTSAELDLAARVCYTPYAVRQAEPVTTQTTNTGRVDNCPRRSCDLRGKLKAVDRRKTPFTDVYLLEF